MRVYNVQPNLAVWSAGNFSVGQRCSDAGGANAYQCITGGNSTAAPSGQGSSINNGGGAVFKWLSLIDFTSLPACISNLYYTLGAGGTNSGLLQAIWIANWNNGTLTSSVGAANWLSYGPINSNGFSTTITVAAGEGWNATTSDAMYFNAAKGCSFQMASTGTGSLGWYIAVNNTYIDSWQFYDGNPASTSGANGNIIVVCATASVTVKNCVFDATGHMVYFPGTMSVIENCFLRGRQTIQSGGTPLWPVKWDVNATGAAVNCTAFGSSASTASGPVSIFTNLNGNVGSVFAINCAAFGFPDPFYSQNVNGAIAVSYCCTDVSSLSGSGSTDAGHNLFSQTLGLQFANTASNFQLISTSTCINAGQSEPSYISTSTDAYGTPRPNSVVDPFSVDFSVDFGGSQAWDIGADEYIPPPPTPPPPTPPPPTPPPPNPPSPGPPPPPGAGAVLTINPFTQSVVVNSTVTVSGTWADVPEILIYEDSSAVMTASPFSMDFSSDFGSGAISYTSSTPIAAITLSQVSGVWSDVFTAPLTAGTYTVSANVTLFPATATASLTVVAAPPPPTPPPPTPPTPPSPPGPPVPPPPPPPPPPQVGPSLTINPITASVTVNTTVSISGTWTDIPQVIVSEDGTVLDALTLQTVTGTWTDVITAPLTAGSYTVSASSTLFGLTASTMLTVTPAIAPPAPPPPVPPAPPGPGGPTPPTPPPPTPTPPAPPPPTPPTPPPPPPPTPPTPPVFPPEPPTPPMTPPSPFTPQPIYPQPPVAVQPGYQFPQYEKKPGFVDMAMGPVDRMRSWAGWTAEGQDPIFQQPENTLRMDDGQLLYGDDPQGPGGPGGTQYGNDDEPIITHLLYPQPGAGIGEFIIGVSAIGGED